jgi:LysR family transcriptional activator of nhaA
MAHWLNYHHLLYFREIACEGSIAAAAEKLSLSPSALSMQLKNLENTLGHKIFERRSKKLFLTDFGRHALEYAEEIYRVGEEFVHTVNNASFNDKSMYRIGLMDGLPKSFAQRAVRLLKGKYPDSPLSLYQGNFENLKQDLLNHELDVVLSNFAPLDQSDLFFVKSFGKEPVSLFGTEKFKHLSTGFPESLKEVPMVLPNKHSKLRPAVEYWFNSNGIQYILAAEVQDSSLKKQLAQDNVGLVPLPRFSAQELVTDGKLIEIGKMEGVFEEYFVIIPKRHLKVPLTEFFLSSFK